MADSSACISGDGAAAAAAAAGFARQLWPRRDSEGLGPPSGGRPDAGANFDSRERS